MNHMIILGVWKDLAKSSSHKNKKKLLNIIELMRAIVHLTEIYWFILERSDIAQHNKGKIHENGGITDFFSNQKRFASHGTIKRDLLHSRREAAVLRVQQVHWLGPQF